MQSLHSVHRSFYVFGGELNFIATLQYVTYVRSFLTSDCRRLQQALLPAVIQLIGPALIFIHCLCVHMNHDCD